MELPFRVFSEINATDNLSLLTLYGTPSQAELTEAWEGIQLQYADEMKEPQYRNYIRIQRELADAQLVHTQCTMLIRALEQVYVEEFKRELDHLLRCYLSLDPENKEEYDNQLQRARNRLKGQEIGIQLKIAELEAIGERLGFGEDRKPNTKYFWDVIEALEQYHKTPVDIDVTTYRICLKYRSMVEEVERNKTTTKK